ncbi:methyl-accepting chemotaxis protein [Roseomonas sp. GC11]|uniref:methyl-accepting chemotaxis protein n=1 Tax=Roseomonas sp. GC11 TaxID=2950546 RepID=UPI00210CC683|nr:HAMP domain-containing methyl-accepting chemotaxis protein [Roseomonas sp. GC11]MCQ4160745.1 methyl-accepting chemotaxis protein [Roseomonas sp. GC11]
MRIRTLFLAGFCAVGLPGALASLLLAGQAYEAWRVAGQATLDTRALSAAQRSQTALALEVGQYASSISTPTPDMAALRAAAPVTDQLLARLDQAMPATSLADAAKRAPGQIIQDLATLRRRAEEAFTRPPAQRDPTLAADLGRARGEMAGRAAELGAGLTRFLARGQPELMLPVEIANAVMDQRDLMGRNVVLLFGWVNGGVVERAAYNNFQGQLGRAQQAYESARRLAAVLEGRPRLQEAVRLYATRSEELATRLRQQAELAAPHLGQPAPRGTWAEGSNEMRRWTAPGLAALLDLRDAALDEALAISDHAHGAALRELLLALGLVVLTTLLAIGSLVLLMRRLVQPLRALTGSVARIAEGVLDLSVPGRARPDELGEMARAVETLRQGSLERRAMQEAQQQAQQAELARAQRIGALLNSFEEDTAGMLRVVASAATELDATAASMAGIAADGTRHAGDVAEAASQASQNVQTVAAAAEQLAASIAEVARQVQDGARQARSAVQAADQAGRTVHGLSEAANRIGDVVQLINSIAGQTNLLALNATIEAARAGEAGKGFAVVASEVKTLASQTAKATEEISAQIAAMQAETGRTVQAIGAITAIIEQINNATAQVAEAAGQQAEATQEIGRAVAKAAAGTNAASRHATGVSADAERTGSAATEVRAASGELAQRAEALRGQMERFLTSIRAA